MNKNLTPDQLEERRRKTRERVAAHRAKKKAEAAAASGDGKPQGRIIDQVPAEDRALIAEHLNARSTRLLGASQEAYETDLAAWALECGADGLLSATFTGISTWIASQTRDPRNPDDKRPWSRRTARRKLSAIQSFYKWAVREGRIPGNPAAGIELWKPEKHIPAKLSKPDVQRIFDYIEGQIALRDDRSRELYLLFALIARMMYHMGFRVSEAVSLRVSQIRREEGELRAYPFKKGDKVKGYPLTGEVLHAYERWMLQRAQIEVKPDHADFLCIHPWHGERVKRKWAWTQIRRIAERAGLAREVLRLISPHKLRHAIAYHMMDEGYSITEVQALLDHEDIRTTQIYTEHDEKARMQIIRMTSKPVRRPRSD